jgi:hypothetical protein
VDWWNSIKDTNSFHGELLGVRSLFFKVSDSDKDLLELVEAINRYALDNLKKVLSLIDSNDIVNTRIETAKIVKEIKNLQNQLSKGSGRLQRTGTELR